MSHCRPIILPDGTVVLANIKSGEHLTGDEMKAIAEYVQFCRDRRAKKLKSKKPPRASLGDSKQP